MIGAGKTKREPYLGMVSRPYSVETLSSRVNLFHVNSTSIPCQLRRFLLKVLGTDLRGLQAGKANRTAEESGLPRRWTDGEDHLFPVLSL